MTVSANDQVSIRATKTGGDYFFNPYLELYAPNGSEVTNAAGQIDATLAVAGTYLLIVRDDNTAESGTYSLRLYSPTNIPYTPLCTKNGYISYRRRYCLVQVCRSDSRQSVCDDSEERNVVE